VTINNPKLTAREAAEQFAATAFEEPRRVDWATLEVNERTVPHSDSRLVATFRLLGGTLLYDLYALPAWKGWVIQVR